MLKHIGLQYKSKEEAETFFTEILGIPEKKEFTIPAELGKSIFGFEKEVKVKVFSNEKVTFEIFIGNEARKFSYEHICLEIVDKERFISRCKSHGIEPIFIKKGDKELLFIRDFSGYLYEIKEKQ